MPYLRLYSKGLPIEQKRVVAQKLIDITLRAFHLSAKERSRITVQFITQPQVGTIDGVETVQSFIPRDADFMVEVLAHDVTEKDKKAFGEEVVSVLSGLSPTKPWQRLARLIGIQADTASQIALQFSQLSSGVSDPFVEDSKLRAA